MPEQKKRYRIIVEALCTPDEIDNVVSELTVYTGKQGFAFLPENSVWVDDVEEGVNA